MIESIEIEGWNGIGSGGFREFSSRMVLVCSSESHRGAVLAALLFLRITEQDCSVFRRILERSGPIRSTTLASLVAAGGGTIRACVDGLRMGLDIDVSPAGRLRALVQGTREPLFEIGVVGEDLVGLGALSNGPRTMRRKSFICEVPLANATFADLRCVAEHTEQVILIASDWGVVDALFRDAGEEELHRWVMLQLSVTQGVLRAKTRGTL